MAKVGGPSEKHTVCISSKEDGIQETGLYGGKEVRKNSAEALEWVSAFFGAIVLR